MVGWDPTGKFFFCEEIPKDTERKETCSSEDITWLLSDEMQAHWLQKIMPKHTDKGNIRILNPNI